MEEIQNKFRKIINLLSYCSLLLFVSCQSSPEKIDYGKEACASCKMTIVDARFAAEMITAKGRIYKFDDIICMKQYATANADAAKDAQFWVAGYTVTDGAFIDATKGVFLKSNAFASPMNGNYAAFDNEASAQHLKDSLNLEYLQWSSL